MINFDIQKPFIASIDQARLTHVIQTTLQVEKIFGEIELSLVVGDDEQIRALNLEYLGNDTPTDVLSFPSDELDPDTGLRYIGDIILSHPRATEQAALSGHSTTAEIELLVVHAVLHLLGYDHAEPGEKVQMWAVQNSILNQLGTPLKVFPE